MPTILVASDSEQVREAVETALVRPGFSVDAVERGQDVVPRVVGSRPDLVVLDMQIGNMGGMATALDLRLEASAGRCPEVPILLLLDREADRFLARRAQADALLVKPYDPGTLRRSVKALLDAHADQPAGADTVEDGVEDGIEHAVDTEPNVADEEPDSTPEAEASEA